MENRVLSGMRPTGQLHLGHYHGVLKNWLALQNEYDSYFFVADWHAFTTHYSDKIDLESNVIEMVVDWLAAGINPNTSTIFVQSKVPEHAELHLLLSMITPLPWLERVPSYKDQQEKLKTRDLGTYGFLGYPLLQSADILIYKAGLVPVGEDQVAHIELTREVARRFNYVYGREADFEEKAETAITKMGKKQAKSYRALRKAYQETGDDEALIKAQAMLKEQQNITLGDRERLLGYIEGVGRIILPEPESLLTKASKMPGLDGQKMSKSYGNTISLRDSADEIEVKIKRMPTDPARVKLTDAGDPEKCPVWQLHKVYSDEQTCDWVKDGCVHAKMGCVECKQPVIESVQAELLPMQERIAKYQADPSHIKQIIHDGSQRARNVAKETMAEVREAMGIIY
ncbi:tryptophan--tRNA ligase [bacterium endosymbiont of Bathymodiolus sp. 5 South]|jgi:tryptophanyl-tRNA synthetase|uniref:tryptophan--tRNA ligase n=1 Tax=bacterium endosymbiont of Bathymodiolus sp. 5 South TaxID=1181670 RepID=UPI0010BB76BD|nr:tryptophan--tRNA ligase [bacterium endosymbiont of Bathymodiolus sp. 5 South]CAC9449943.1 Tryptophanyl-tRNA synthetase (EC 6.1.1.2) [uncultured Gammaproteobacteria bacterium]CAC9449973.1 Tryptophanyl-tRNA synthetase (EC 6.1.1.2) [uncultured Gammaproteobacteria bacterium]SHN89751.1 Tryptophanyl-tRNA synthetase [bacterium endosymbiont of Bathymodiolus sp. 5 South]SSC08905.1 Tryptophanyl-tRNA synthetase [bacterium endosymbiont of Bathymodiolus sp. 5 South]VVH59665.1 Tryptophanyl-tRNA synthetas